MIPVSQPSSLRELATSTVTEADKRLEAVQRTQISSLSGADKTKEPQSRQSPTLATRPKKYALELWVEVETRAGMYTTPEEDSYSVNFAIDTLNHAYPGCTGVYLGEAGHMLAFYGKKTNLGPASPMIKLLWLVKPSSIFLLRWDTLLDEG